jgi:2'-5' RNA ligase
MPRYGVYLIPSADHPLFRLGSDFLGYNIWAESHATPLLADTLGEETVRAWIGNAKHFSFHITIADCLEYRAEDVDEICTRIQWIAQRMAPFTLTDGRFYTEFHAGHALTLTYKSPDHALQRLHRLVVTLISVLHTSSPYFGHLLEKLEAPLQQNLIRYGAPWVLDHFWPHWSLATSVPDADIWQRLRDETVRVTGLLQTPETQSFTVDSIQLVELKEDGFYRIAGSYPLAGE